MTDPTKHSDDMMLTALAIVRAVGPNPNDPTAETLHDIATAVQRLNAEHEGA